MLLDLQNVRFGYDEKTVLEDVSVTLNPSDKVGLIGCNGAGKTTLLKLITAQLTADEGALYRKSGLSFGYMEQMADFTSENTVYMEMLSAFTDVLAAEKNMRALEVKMAEVPHDTLRYRTLAAEHTALNDFFIAGGGYDIDVKIKTVLNGLGFVSFYDTKVSVMSGGERTRLYLGKQLISHLELLILDEPTNHLDVETIGWLEKYLEGYKGALLIVSHDRYFLDKVVGRIWDLEAKTIHAYNGNYSKFKLLKAEKLKTQEREYVKQQIKIADMKEYAERNIARASTSNSAKSRLHQLANMQLVEKPILYVKPPVFRFELQEESTEQVLAVTDLPLSVQGKMLVDSLSFNVRRGDKLAIVGANGTGKTTLVKTLLGINGEAAEDSFSAIGGLKSSTFVGQTALLRAVNPHIRYGKNLSISYYDQENLNLQEDHTVLEELWRRFPLASVTEMRAGLARLLLTSLDIEKQVSALSGGERAKLGFAIVLQEKSNLIMLDEPTNHLDLSCREALERGLTEYGGTLLFVSHDRYFINSLATKVLELENGKATLYEGNYDEYLQEKKKEGQLEAQQKAMEKERLPAKKGSFRTPKQRSDAVKLRNALAETEQKIADLEARQTELLALMTGGETDYRVLGAYNSEMESNTALLETLYEEWTELSSKLEEIV